MTEEQNAFLRMTKPIKHRKIKQIGMEIKSTVGLFVEKSKIKGIRILCVFGFASHHTGSKIKTLNFKTMRTTVTDGNTIEMDVQINRTDFAHTDEDWYVFMDREVLDTSSVSAYALFESNIVKVRIRFPHGNRDNLVVYDKFGDDIVTQYRAVTDELGKEVGNVYKLDLTDPLRMRLSRKQYLDHLLPHEIEDLNTLVGEDFKSTYNSWLRANFKLGNYLIPVEE